MKSEIRITVLKRDNYKCKYDTKYHGYVKHSKKLDVHHIVPAADGGTDDLDNLKTLCRSHHIAVHEEISWIRMLGRAGETFDDLQIRTGFV
jgi:5-methylcytosine-specific restriction endonuclease McrA